ncbi:vWA domain-containing protein [Neptuniibacter sp. CAU 1671]|uniref:vWA domain-containing protein n=1 Tax=Neptuniibacter sp. CAU 1671 TaxID=3032593 RepID=UPI0023DCDF43|nr:vWA domain-containing protein [Neptuniibacter sp. CAU 1671]MDF2181751.1 VWA domain-containing protein [Neptuniibacter sp. CAU 1671]
MKRTACFTRKLAPAAIASALVAGAGFAPSVSAVEYGACGPMDVVFLIDDSGSMGSVIDSIKASFSSFITEIDNASGGDYQLALVTQDTAAWAPERPEVDVDLAPANGADVTTALSAVFASGGTGWPEPTDAMLDLVINGNTNLTGSNDPSYASCDPTGAGFTSANFRPGADKILILATDAPPGGCDDNYGAADDANVAAITAVASANDFRVSAIATGSGVYYNETKIPLMMYTAGTGGVYAESESGDVSTIISDIISTCGVSANECPLSQGYWKNHEEEWPVESLIVGDDDEYTKEELLAILNTPPKGGNSYLILAHQLIAALLNIENGSDPSVISVQLDAALDALAEVDLTSGAKTKDTELNALAGVLDDYNNRLLTPDCEESADEEVVSE